ncbi:MAG TPA: DUF4249 domain-containing protein [Chryseosolibacter sp.]
MVRYSWLFIVIFLLSDACIDRYDLPEQIVDPKLVVDGMITNRPGPYTISLSTAHDVNTFINNPNPVRNAVVTISDDAGNEEMLTEVSGGIYKTAAGGIQGVIGRKYQLSIETESGEYYTEPQELRDPGTIEDFRYSFRMNSINQERPDKPQHAVNFTLDAKGAGGENSYFRWRWSSVFELQNTPESKTIEAGKPPQTFPNPPACSGYRLAIGGGIERFAVCTCCNCWVYQQSEVAIVSKNSSVSANEFKNIQVAKIPVDVRTFDVRYYIEVDQLSLSEEVYQFWKLIEAQQAGEGSLFQPNSVRVQGNIKSRTNPGEQVLGVFSVSGITSRQIFIDRKDVPFPLEVEKINESCLLYQGATNVKPLFW